MIIIRYHDPLSITVFIHVVSNSVSGYPLLFSLCMFLAPHQLEGD